MLDKSVHDWHAEAAGLVIEGRAFIGGRYEEALSGETRPTMNPGNDPLDPSTAMGPMIDAARLETIAGYVDVGRGEGASLVAGGEQTMLESGGFYYEPTVFQGVNNDMRIAREEIFGPVMSIIG